MINSKVSDEQNNQASSTEHFSSSQSKFNLSQRSFSDGTGLLIARHKIFW